MESLEQNLNTFLVSPYFAHYYIPIVHSIAKKHPRKQKQQETQ